MGRASPGLCLRFLCSSSICFLGRGDASSLPAAAQLHACPAQSQEQQSQGHCPSPWHREGHRERDWAVWNLGSTGGSSGELGKEVDGEQHRALPSAGPQSPLPILTERPPYSGPDLNHQESGVYLSREKASFRPEMQHSSSEGQGRFLL